MLAFQFASTNLVIELGIVLWVLIGWQFTLAEFLGGLVLIAIMTVLLRLFVSALRPLPALFALTLRRGATGSAERTRTRMARRLSTRPQTMRDHERMPAPRPLFFFGAMSPYSWFAAERIGSLLPDAQWRGVLAGPLFKANGRVSWGLTERREEGIADCAGAGGDARTRPDPLAGALADERPARWRGRWPTQTARGMLVPFALSAMRLAFLDGRDLGARDAVLEAGRRAGIDTGGLESAARATRRSRTRCAALTDEALALGVFGVPTVALGDGAVLGR